MTFLLTDIEGSTRSWERAPGEMGAAVARHYELLAGAVGRWGGVRPVEQGEGDSIVAAFSRASDAVAAAVQAQRALLAEPWPSGVSLAVRMAVHTGEAQLRDEGNYMGPTVIRCARLRACGHGGQILVSDATAALCLEHLPEGCSLRELGAHRLKDLARSQRIWQVVHGALPDEFPPLRSLDTFPHNLPTQLTPLVGRGSEVVDVVRTLGRERVVTLVGAGGVGKTRLAAQAAADVVEGYPNGVWWVDLAVVSDGADVAAAVLAAVGAVPDPQVSLTEQIVRKVGGAPSLLVLDNCEHVVVACAEVVSSVLRACSDVSVLATSREPLAVPGEVNWRVPSLSSPPPDHPPVIGTLAQYEAVGLFLERARRARPSLPLTDSSVAAIAQICHRLDGIPLAIELAAARCRTLPPERIAVALEQSLRLLTGGARTLLPRQQTVVASVEWSHDLLEPVEQLVFRRLSVFTSLFTLDAAEAVVAAHGDADTWTVLEVLSRLVDKSLVVLDDTSGDARYRVLETIRAVALDRAGQAGELERCRDEHADWYARWLGSFGAGDGHLLTDDQLDAIVDAYPNVRAALVWSLGTARALDMVAALSSWWNIVAPLDGLALADAALASTKGTYPAAWSKAAASLALLRMQHRDFRFGEDVLPEAITLAANHGDRYSEVMARFVLEGHYHPRTRVARGTLEVVRQHGWPMLRFETAFTCAIQELLAGHLDDAVRYLDESEAQLPADGCSFVSASIAFARSDVALIRGALDDAVRILDPVDTTSRHLGPHTKSMIVHRRGMLALMQGDRTGLLRHFDEAATLARVWPAAELAVSSLEVRLAQLDDTAVDVMPFVRSLQRHRFLPGAVVIHRTLDAVLDNEDVDHATSVVAAMGLQAAASDGAPLVQASSSWADATIAAVAGDLRAAEGAYHRALQISVDHGYCLVALDALEGLAVCAAEGDSLIEAVRLVGAAQRLREETSITYRSRRLDERVQAALAQAHSVLADGAVDDALRAGASLEWRAAAEYAARARGQRGRPNSGWDSLTPTERKVVALLADGRTNPQIAEQLLMSRATVRTHVEHVLTKLGLSSQVEVAAEAVRREHRDHSA